MVIAYSLVLVQKIKEARKFFGINVGRWRSLHFKFQLEPHMDPQFRKNLRDAILKTVENQLVNRNPPETKQTYDRLLREGHSENAAKLLIVNVFAAEIFEVVNRHEPFNHHLFAKALNRLSKIPGG
jgi:hypothetical protein